MSAGSTIGITSDQLAALPAQSGSAPVVKGVVSFYLPVQTVTGTSAYQLLGSGEGHTRLRVIGLKGVVTGGAGAGSVVLKKNGSSGTAITDTISLTTLPDQGVFDAATIDDSAWTIDNGDTLTVVTASNALAFVLVECIWAE